MQLFYLNYSNTTEKIDWINSLYDGESELMNLKKRADKFDAKVTDFNGIVENVMENLFTYDGLYERIKNGFNNAKDQYSQVNTLNSDTVDEIDDGKNLIDEARGFLVDSQNNFQVIDNLISSNIIFQFNYLIDFIYFAGFTRPGKETD